MKSVDVNVDAGPNRPLVLNHRLLLLFRGVCGGGSVCAVVVVGAIGGGSGGVVDGSGGGSGSGAGFSSFCWGGEEGNTKKRTVRL